MRTDRLQGRRSPSIAVFLTSRRPASRVSSRWISKGCHWRNWPGRWPPTGSSSYGWRPNELVDCWPVASCGTSIPPRRAGAWPRCCRPCWPTAAAPAWTPAGWCSSGDQEFFAITKRLHNRLHGAAGDGGPLGEAEHDALREVPAGQPGADQARGPPERHRAAARPADRRPGGRPARAGRDRGLALPHRPRQPNERPIEGWDFLRPYVEHADAFIFSRAGVCAGLGRPRIGSWVIPPSIDPFSGQEQGAQPPEVDGDAGPHGPAGR